MVIDPRSFQIGQAVQLKDMHFGFRVTPQPEGEPGLTVVEVGAEQLVLDDPSTGTRIRIPLYLVNKQTHGGEESAPAA